MAQLNYDEELRPLHGMYGSMEADFEVQRTIKRAELTAFLCLHQDSCGHKGIIDELRKGEKECIKPRAGDADLWFKNWEELHELVKRGIIVEVAHVKTHRTKKEEEKMTQLERFVTEGNEKVEELAKAGAMLDEGFMAEARANYEAGEGSLQYAASFRCFVEEWKDCEELRPKPKEKLIFVDKRRKRRKHRTEWCAEANRYRCMRCGKVSKYMKNARQM